MKKFATLLIALLAINYSLAQTACVASTDANNAFTARIKAIEAASYSANQVATTAEACGTGSNICCVIAGTRTLVQNQITKVKDAIKTFGDKVGNVGKEWTKINNLVTATAITGTTSATAALEAASTTDASGATGAQFKAFATYTGDAFKTDFTNFQGQAIGCLTYYSEAIQRIACDGCKDAANVAGIPARWKSTTSAAILVNAAGANKWAEACNKVWYFMWKVGWFTQAIAFLNNKKNTAFTYTAPAAASVYFNQAGNTIESINTAFTNCYPDATVTACTAANKATLTKVFVQVWGADTRGVGRSDTTIIGGTTSFASNGRRILPTTSDGTIDVNDTDGLDVSTGTAMIQPTAAVAITTAERDAWSHGYVAPSSSSSSASTSTSTSSKNAKVLFGTVLSFLAVALLN